MRKTIGTYLPKDAASERNVRNFIFHLSIYLHK